MNDAGVGEAAKGAAYSVKMTAVAKMALYLSVVEAGTQLAEMAADTYASIDV